MEKLRKYYVVDSILQVKQLILGESFVTDLECRKISEALEKKLKKNGYSIEIATQLESSCPFEVISHGIIVEKDYKTVLQEELQKNGDVKIEYHIISEKGPDHDKIFEAEVSLNGKVLAQGKGKSKKEAEMQAAKKALEN